MIKLKFNLKFKLYNNKYFEILSRAKLEARRASTVSLRVLQAETRLTVYRLFAVLEEQLADLKLLLGR